MLVDDAATAPDTVKLAVVNALVHLLATDGTTRDGNVDCCGLLLSLASSSVRLFGPQVACRMRCCPRSTCWSCALWRSVQGPCCRSPPGQSGHRCNPYLSRPELRACAPPCRLAVSQPLVALLRAVFQLQHCTLVDVPDEQLCAVLEALAAAVDAFGRTPRFASHHEHRLRWCCLDGLRVSAESVLAQLYRAPQCAGE
jgi:hypothetical protein